MNSSLILLLLLFCGCNNEHCVNDCLVGGPSKPMPRTTPKSNNPSCPRKESFECDKKTKYEEPVCNSDNRIFGPFNNQNPCGCD